FRVEQTNEGLRLYRLLPRVTSLTRLGPCFMISSREPGMAGLVKLQVHAQVPGAARQPAPLEQTALVTDEPTLFAPRTLDVSDLAQVTTFELRQKGEVLGVLSLCPVPTAGFTSAGGV